MKKRLFIFIGIELFALLYTFVSAMFMFNWTFNVNSIVKWIADFFMLSMITTLCIMLGIETAQNHLKEKGASYGKPKDR